MVLNFFKSQLYGMCLLQKHHSDEDNEVVVVSSENLTKE